MTNEKGAGNPEGAPGRELSEAEEDAAFELSLLRHYLAGAELKCARMGEALDEARAANARPEAVDALGRSLHMLAGNAGTYGFPALSTRARELSKLVHSAKILSPELASAVEAFVAQMRAAFDKAKAALPPESNAK